MYEEKRDKEKEKHNYPLSKLSQTGGGRFVTSRVFCNTEFYNHTLSL
jgi:hypothetical protein